MPKRPKDLVTLDEAARAVDKSKSSLRYYLKKKYIIKYYQVPNKRNSPVLISLFELKNHLRKNAAPKGKGSKGRPKSKVVSREVIKQQLEEANKEIIMLKAEIKMKDELIKMAQQHTDDVKKTRDQLDNVIKDLRVDLSLSNERNEKLDNRITILSNYLAQPWWRRFGKAVPLLTG